MLQEKKSLQAQLTFHQEMIPADRVLLLRVEAALLHSRLCSCILHICWLCSRGCKIHNQLPQPLSPGVPSREEACNTLLDLSQL